GVLQKAVAANAFILREANIDDESYSERGQDACRQEIPLRWKLPPDADAKLVEFHGRLKGMVWYQGVAIQTADLKKAGVKPIMGREGFKMTVKKYHHKNDGKLEIEVAVGTPPDSDAEQSNLLHVKMVGAGIEIADDLLVNGHEFRIWDSKERSFKILAKRI